MSGFVFWAVLKSRFPRNYSTKRNNGFLSGLLELTLNMTK